MSSTQVNSKLVWNYFESRYQLGSHNKVTLAWLPGHEGHQDNEDANKLACEDFGHSFHGITIKTLL